MQIQLASKLRNDEENEWSVLRVSGRFDAFEAPAAREEIAAQLEAGVSHILVDLSKVNFIDSTALAILVQGMKNCRQAEGDLCLCGLQQPVRIIFELTRLDKAFVIYASCHDALIE